MTALIAAVATSVIYLMSPDIMTPIETLLFLITVFGATAYVTEFIREQVQSIRDKRKSLQIRKAKRHEDKVIDFPVRSRVRHIPAFKVVGK